MSKALVVYFSQSGSTEKVAEHIAAGLRNASYNVELYNIKDNPPAQIESYDLLGIGLPAYYFRPPFNVLDYVNNLSDLRGKPTFVFVTKGSHMGDAGNGIRRILTRKGARDAGYFCCWGANYFLPYLKKGYFLNPDHPTKEELKNAEAFGCEIADNAAKAKFGNIPYDPPLRNIFFRMARFFTCRLFMRTLVSRLFFLKNKKCDACGECIKVCPVKNIKADKDQRPIWGRDCILCAYCVLKCPQDAVISPAHLPSFYILAQYFCLPYALKNPQIDRVRVVLKANRIEVIENK